MKASLLAMCLLASIVQVYGQATTNETHSYSYNWKLHEKLIDEIFEKECKNRVISEQRAMIETVLPKEKADLYMQNFEKGMASNTGFIRYEFGEDRRWLELAFSQGYKAKQLFRQGYMNGLTKKAEHPDVMKELKPNGEPGAAANGEDSRKLPSAHSAGSGQVEK